MRFQVVSLRLALVGVLLSLAVPASTGASATTSDVSTTSPRSTCGEGLMPVGDGLCTHGGDHAAAQMLQPAFGSTERTALAANDPCPGDGASGPRLRVYYGYPSDTAPKPNGLQASIRESVSIADRNLNAQTPGVGGQHFRMFCEDDRKVSVRKIALIPIGADNYYSFDDVIDSFIHRVANGLGEKNIDIDRFTYVVFVDNVECCYGPAGQGTVYWDDRPDPDVNYNNRVKSGPRFAMIEISGDSTTDAFRFLHEVGHTLGAVQLTAPHTTGLGHCYTNVDVMCSFDGGWWFVQGGDMEEVCPQPPEGEFTFDCEGGDYYEIDPGPGNYLRTHWNTSDSAWLTRPR